MNPVASVKNCHVTSCPVLLLIIQALYALGENTENSPNIYYPMHFGKKLYRHILKTNKQIFQ